MSIRLNKLFPFRSQPHSAPNSKENSLEKLPAYESLHKNKKLPLFPNPYLKKKNLRKGHPTEEATNKHIDRSS